MWWNGVRVGGDRTAAWISRPDVSTLKYEVTVDDPRTYTRPWTGGWTLQWVPGEDIEEYFCEEGNTP